MSFARRFPAHLLPQVEDALAHLLHGVGEGEWEVLILKASEPKRPNLYVVGEADEQPTIQPEVHDE